MWRTGRRRRRRFPASIAAQLMGKMAGDGQPQAAAARAAVARAFQPIEGLEYLFQLLRRNAGAVVARAG